MDKAQITVALKMARDALKETGCMLVLPVITDALEDLQAANELPARYRVMIDGNDVYPTNNSAKAANYYAMACGANPGRTVQMTEEVIVQENDMAQRLRASTGAAA